jgi:hypothetical protein
LPADLNLAECAFFFTQLPHPRFVPTHRGSNQREDKVLDRLQLGIGEHPLTGLATRSNTS